MPHPELWPALPLSAWRDTRETLHLWTQIVGKVRMTMSPVLNHWWHVTLYVNARGLTTGPVPYAGGTFEIQFDFVDQALKILTSCGEVVSRPLRPESVAAFYDGLMGGLASVGIRAVINLKPQELPDPIPFDQDLQHHSYDGEFAQRFWRVLVSTAAVMERFRGRYLGKCSPVHFFWGSFDLACTRFSGRPAPLRKGAISGPAYSHEVSSAGFWPGGGVVDDAAFYAYTVPTPVGIEAEPVRPAEAHWNSTLSEFILMYEDVRSAASPADTLYAFLESTYLAGARLGAWDRALEL